MSIEMLIAFGIVAVFLSVGLGLKKVSQPGAIMGPHKMVGATFLFVDCRDCMASDHQVLWAGVGEAVGKVKVHGAPDGTYDEVRIRKLKCFGRAGNWDARDKPQDGPEWATAIVQDGAVQELAPGLYAIFK